MSKHDLRRETDLPEPADSTRRAAKEIVETVLLALVVYATMRVFVHSFRIEGSSMEPSMVHGQYILVG